MLKIASSEDAAHINAPRSSRDSQPEIRNQASEEPKATNESVSWLTWFSRSDPGMAHSHGDGSDVDKSRSQSIISDCLQDASTSPKRRRNSEPSPVTPTVRQEEAPRSWLSLWGNGSTQMKSTPSASALGLASNPQIESDEPSSQRAKSLDPGSPVLNLELSKQRVDSTKSSFGWAFWSRDQGKSDNEKTRPRREIGELAIAGSSSQPKLERAVLDEARVLPNMVGKRQRPQSLETADGLKKPQYSGDDARKDPKTETITLAPKIITKVDAESKEKRTAENLLLPSFRSTYCTVERPSLIQQVSRLLQMSSSSESRHVNIVPNPPLVKRALAIVSLAQSIHSGGYLSG